MQGSSVGKKESLALARRFALHHPHFNHSSTSAASHARYRPAIDNRTTGRDSARAEAVVNVVGGDEGVGLGMKEGWCWRGAGQTLQT